MPLYRFDSKIVLFVHIPKTGGSTIEQIMRDAGGVQAMLSTNTGGFSRCNYQHVHAEVMNKLIPTRFVDYSFAVVRNPYDRIASEYRMKKTRQPDRTPEFSEWLQQACEAYEQNPYALDNHMRPQTEFLVPGCNVFRFEDGLDRAAAAALSANGLPIPDAPLPHNKKPDVVEVRMSTRDEARIRDLYRSDFEAFGYSPN